MIWSHLRALAWVRWRVAVNRFQRVGVLGQILATLLLALLTSGAALTFLISFLLGVFLLPNAQPNHILYCWDAVVGTFLLFWSMGLVTDLQRSELLPLGKLLYLPVTPSGMFALNFFSSLLSVTLILFLPAMVALAMALVVTHGAAMLMVFPLIAGFVLMVTAVTHQFRGWLAALMENKRRRRAIIVLFTTGFILVVQLPNLYNIFWRGSHRDASDAAREDHLAAMKELTDEVAAGSIAVEEYTARADALQKQYTDRQEQAAAQSRNRITRWITIANVALPPGWLPYGARAAAARQMWPSLLGLAGLVTIGLASLWGSYRTTLGIYRGASPSFVSRTRLLRGVVRPAKAAPNWLEKRVPWLSEPATAVALANLRSVSRAPEAKMNMVSPIIIFALVGLSIYSTASRPLPTQMRPLVALGLTWLAMFSVLQLAQNLFGYDRDGFRALVLSPARRRDILLGKNVSLAPIGFGVGLIALMAMQMLIPLSVAHFLASLVQMGSLYLVLCMTGNVVSILAPLATSAGALRRSRPSATTIALQFLFALAIPLVTVPLLIPCGLALLCDYLGWLPYVPVYPLLALLTLGLTIYIYSRVLTLEGRLLERRQLAILETVTSGRD